MIYLKKHDIFCSSFYKASQYVIENIPDRKVEDFEIETIDDYI